MKMNSLISIEQLPVIRDRLKDLSEQIDKEVSDALTLAVTEETLVSVKKVRAKLRKDYEELETQRKAVKNAIMERYSAFENEVYKPMIAVRYEEGDAELKRKINSVENQLKQEKNEELAEYFYELCAAEHLDWLEYERGNFNVTLTKSRTALHNEVNEFVGRVSNDMTAISVMPDAEEVAVEYKRTLRLGDAVETVRKRKEAVEQERRERELLAEMRRAEKEHEQKVMEAVKIAEPVAVYDGPTPVENDDPVKTLSFTVTAPVSKLKELKDFLNNGGYDVG